MCYFSIWSTLELQNLDTIPISFPIKFNHFFFGRKESLINDEQHENEYQQISQNATPPAHALVACKIKQNPQAGRSQLLLTSQHTY